MNYGRISLNYLYYTTWHHFLAPHTDKIQELAKSPDHLFCEVTQPSENLLSKTRPAAIVQTTGLQIYITVIQGI